MTEETYKQLAERLDALPNGFPPTEDGVELKLLAKIFTPEEAALTSQLRMSLETADEIAARVGGDPDELTQQLKGMSRRGLISAGRTDRGLGFRLMPFVVGIYEAQIGSIDAELSRLFEDYYTRVFGQVLAVRPQVHRVIPVKESLSMDVEVLPFESAAEILNRAEAWGVLECICRKQKALIGDPCEHPLEICMAFHTKPGAFEHSSTVRALTKEEAFATLHRAAEAGLVHTVSNNQEGANYICNCCTCSCGILRGMADLGIANVVARSAFVNQVDEDLCMACEICLDYCQFDALTMDDVAVVDRDRCVGCGVCVLTCPDEALGLVRRPVDEVLSPPETERDWLMDRAEARGMDLSQII